jgi:Flp pilus assembly protein TadB
LVNLLRIHHTHGHEPGRGSSHLGEGHVSAVVAWLICQVIGLLLWPFVGPKIAAVVFVIGGPASILMLVAEAISRQMNKEQQ